MSEPASFRTIIGLWGDGRPAWVQMAADIGSTVDSVRKWWDRDRIPDEWWQAVLSSDVAVAAGVSADLLVRLAAREPAEARV